MEERADGGHAREDGGSASFGEPYGRSEGDCQAGELGPLEEVRKDGHQPGRGLRCRLGLGGLQ